MGAKTSSSLLAGVEPPPAKPSNCGIRRLRDGLDPDTRADLDAMLADPVTWGHTTLAHTLGDVLDVNVTDRVIARHRGGLCACQS